MALFFRDDDYDESVRQVGFARYRQLLSTYFGRWLVVNLLTLLGSLPLAAGIAAGILWSSVLVLIPASLLGGMVFGPFLAGLYDAILRGLRDAPGSWRENYRRSWRQNAVGSLLPGALLGLMAGMFAFMLYLLYSATAAPGWGTLLPYLFSMALCLLIATLYWPQLVLFRQSNGIRLRNAVLFTIRHFGCVALSVLLQLGYLLVFVLFAPWTLLLLPLLGYWYIVFVSQFVLYDALDAELHIEEQFDALDA
ncbi:MAG: hypothetical protein K6G54_00365 [Oscillospiraceae bacterium]|nr:hypothetical protein [Oscillospiraceae bacterium]